MTVLTVSSPVFSSLFLFIFFFLSRFSPLYPYSLLSSFFLSLSFFLFCPPCFYRPKQGEGHGWGSHYAAAPPTRGKCGLCRRLFEREIGENRGKKNLLLPLPCASRGRRRPTVLFKTTPFESFFI